ncbi:MULTISPECIES: hypothetical protein [Planktothrix]|jgi:hypothetical protein|nr:MULTISPECIES: hypothetical protein [Planktothrix]MCF3606034.1 hypothetical protein [Planktothrix agardhii 1033]CAD5909470.1 hypothetical protein NO108_00023 [Planktothrix rubescens]BBD55835.1 hypothetical protein NIES204_31530 [Planktothrix agardhii NIES-204]MBG0745212.1 hypothetical protein [Planktothrix agardhii KL2]MCB8750101.1 hypothetical protein [Planktothrix agardhii 1810]
MSIQDETITKIKHLPDELVKKVNNFIDFLLINFNKNSSDFDPILNEDLEISESDFSDYLKNLEDYEERLAQGEIKW